MGQMILKFTAVIFILIGASAFAQEREAPSSQEQVMFSYAPLVKKVSPAVVNIYTKRVVTKRVKPFGNNPVLEKFFGGAGSVGGLTRQQVESSLGSGLIIEAEGVVITNAHVVKDAKEISVVLADGREFDAKLSLSDPRSDLAVLRVETKGEKLPFASLKPSESIEVGDIVIAIGNPFGVGQSVTSGIVSALARSSLNINAFNFFIQTDAAVNPGNSGGPLVAMDGGIIGINTAIFSRGGGSLGIGFAIPSEMVATVVAAEKSGAGSAGVIRPWIGVSGQQVTSDIADSLGLSRPAGVLLTKLHKVSPARKAGVKIGDVVTAVNGRKIRNLAEMKFRLATVPLGKKAKMDILRKGKALFFEVEAIAPPEIPLRHEKTLEGAHPLNGAKVANISPAVAVELGLSSRLEGVVVMAVSRGAQAARFVKPGDIIVSINNQKIENTKDIGLELDQAARLRQGFVLVIERVGRRTQMVIR